MKIKCSICGKEFEAKSIKCELCSKERGEQMYHLYSDKCNYCGGEEIK
jgi:DNA-directed RNA polymerase subunit RPC12/RpoP